MATSRNDYNENINYVTLWARHRMRLNPRAYGL